MLRLFPFARVVREGTPHVNNFFVQHEGPLGVLGSNNLVSLGYADLVNEKQRDATSTGGWLGIGDKDWAAAVISDPAAPITARFSYTKPATTDIYQTSFVETNPVTIASGAAAQDELRLRRRQGRGGHRLLREPVSTSTGWNS